MHVDKSASAESPELAGRTRLSLWECLERGGEVRLAVVPNRRKKAIQEQVRNDIAAGSALYSDALQSYDGSVSGIRASSDRPC